MRLPGELPGEVPGELLELPVEAPGEVPGELLGLPKEVAGEAPGELWGASRGMSHDSSRGSRGPRMFRDEAVRQRVQGRALSVYLRHAFENIWVTSEAADWPQTPSCSAAGFQKRLLELMLRRRRSSQQSKGSAATVRGDPDEGQHSTKRIHMDKKEMITKGDMLLIAGLDT